MAWKEHCEKKAKARKARLKRNGGAARGQRKWARRRKEKERIEIIRRNWRSNRSKRRIFTTIKDFPWDLRVLS